MNITKSDTKHIFSLKIHNFYMLSISKWYINYLLQNIDVITIALFLKMRKAK